MSSDTDFKALWQSQQTSIPDTVALFEKAKHFKKSNLKKVITANVLLLFTAVFIAFVWYWFHPQLLSTRIGIVIIIAAIVLYLIVYNRIIPLLLKSKVEISSHAYLQQLLSLQQKQGFLQTTIMNIYFILLSAGLCLYMYEYTSQMQLAGAVIAYSITLAWVLFNWFYLRPKMMKKEQEKINVLISKFRELNEQLTSEK